MLATLIAIVMGLFIPIPGLVYPPVFQPLGSVSPVAPPGPASVVLPIHQGPFYPAVELYAARKVLADFHQAAQRLQNEAWNLEYDARALWQRWTQHVRAQGSLYSWIYAPDKKTTVQRGWEEKRQSEILALYGKIQTLHQNIRRIFTRIHNTELQWENLRESLEEAVLKDKDGSELRAEFNALKANLAARASELNNRDSETAALQQDYDYLRPLAMSHLNRISQATVLLDPPWHSLYSFSGTPRPYLQYDFEERWESYRRQGLKEFGISRNKK